MSNQTSPILKDGTYPGFRFRAMCAGMPPVNRLNSLLAFSGSVSAIVEIFPDKSAPVMPKLKAGSTKPPMVPVRMRFL